jgi:hypothetical protein
VDVDSDPNQFRIYIAWIADMQVAAECIAGRVRGVWDAIYGTYGEWRTNPKSESWLIDREESMSEIR